MENISEKKPFFIFGCGRSGTSLLSRMLNQHSHLAVPYESHLFNTFFPLLKYYGNLSEEKNRRRLISDILMTDVMNDWKPKLNITEILSSVKENSFGGIFDSILTTWASKNNKIRWGEKTPHHVDYWDKISQKWPCAKVIHIYRDGRDVALSLKNARFGPKTIYANAYYWKNYLERVNQLKNKIEPTKFFEMSYENLLENPETELKKLCDFLGEDFEQSMLEFYKNKNEYKTDDQNRQNLMKPVIKNNSEKWRTEMSKKELRVFEAISGNLLKEYGYEVINEKPYITSVEHFYFGKILSPIKKNMAMIKNKKGHKDSLIKLTIKLKLILFGFRESVK